MICCVRLQGSEPGGRPTAACRGPATANPFACDFSNFCLRSGSQEQCFSNCDPGTSSVCLTWELVGNNLSDLELGLLGVEPSNALHKPSRDVLQAGVWEPVPQKPSLRQRVRGHVVYGRVFSVREAGQGRPQQGCGVSI